MVKTWKEVIKIVMLVMFVKVSRNSLGTLDSEFSYEIIIFLSGVSFLLLGNWKAKPGVASFLILQAF